MQRGVLDSSVWAALPARPGSEGVLPALPLPAMGTAMLGCRGGNSSLPTYGFQQVLGDWLRSPCTGVYRERHLLSVRAHSLNRQSRAAEEDVMISECRGDG